MTESIGLNQILARSTQELVACTEDLLNRTPTATGGGVEQLRSDEKILIDQLIENLENATQVLHKEIESGRVIKIDPTTVAQMDQAIESAMDLNILDAKINAIYMSVFGWNTDLWHVLKRMQNLLRTVNVLKDKRGKKVAQVEKSQKTGRKRRDQD